MGPASGENFPSGQRRNPAAPGDDNVPSLDHNSFHTSITQTSRGQNWSWSMPRRTRGRQRPIPGSETISYIHMQSHQPRDKTPLRCKQTNPPGSPGIDTKQIGQRTAVYGGTDAPKIPPFRGGDNSIRSTLGWVIDRYFALIAQKVTPSHEWYYFSFLISFFPSSEAI